MALSQSCLEKSQTVSPEDLTLLIEAELEGRVVKRLDEHGSLEYRFEPPTNLRPHYFVGIAIRSVSSGDAFVSFWGSAEEILPLLKR